MAETAKKRTSKPRAPRVKDWRRTAGYRDVRKALTDALGLQTAMDSMVADKVEEYMSLWCQRQMLYDDVRKRGPTVLDDRGRVSENRSISLGVQVSKQMLALYASLGFDVSSKRGAAGPEKDDGEDDPL